MRVAVVGAGVSGIAAAKCLLDLGIEPTVYERAPGPGGVWRYDETLADGGGPAYRGLHTNTSKQTTAFSDFPFPAGLPDFPPRALMLHYLDDYADHFKVFERIHFGTEVMHLTPLDGGRWSVLTRRGDQETTDTFDGVMICSGVFSEPVTPTVPGAETFTGTILHSQEYTVPEHFADKRVVVVGNGSSATDVAQETSAVATTVYLSARASEREVPAPPAPFVATLRGLRDRVLPVRLRSRLVRYARLRWARRQGRRLPGPDAPFVTGPDPYKVNPKLAEPIVAGKVVLKPGIARIDGSDVAFSDGSRVTADVIVFATGYLLRLPFLDPDIFTVSMAGLDLYRLVCLPNWPTLAFVGLFRVSGPAPPVAEMQARWAAHVLHGDVTLPSPAEMRQAIAARHALIKQHGGNPFRLFAEAYEDILASEIGALPRLGRHPRLWRALLLGPAISARHRLDGPNAWVGAARTLLDAQGASVAPNVVTRRAAEG